MPFGPLALVLTVLAVCALFGAVIFFGLCRRRAGMAANLEIRAQALWAPFAQSGGDFDALLYGIFQDFSFTQMGMIVRDSRDRETGRITFHTAARRGAITIIAADVSYEADVLPTLLRRVALRSATDGREVLCTYTRRPWGSLRFDVTRLGAIEGTVDGRFRLAPRFAFSLAAKRFGFSEQIGGAVNRGVLLALPGTIPPHIRMFMLAMLA